MGGSALAHCDHCVDRQQFFAAIVLQSGHFCHFFVPIFRAQFNRLGEACDLCGGLRAGAQTALLSAAGEQRLGIAQRFGDVQSADALGTADFVGAEAHQIHTPRGGCAGDFQKALHRVAMQQCAALSLAQQRRRLLYGEDAAGLVVHQHHTHKDGVLAQGGSHLLCRYVTGAVGLEIGHLIALLLQPFARLQNGAVLHGGGDDMATCVAAVPHGGVDGPVVALRAAGGEEKPLRLAAHRLGHGAAAALHQRFGLLSQGVLGGGVAKLCCQYLQHRLRRFGGDRGGGGVIQIVHKDTSFSVYFRGAGDLPPARLSLIMINKYGCRAADTAIIYYSKSQQKVQGRNRCELLFIPLAARSINMKRRRWSRSCSAAATR